MIFVELLNPHDIDYAKRVCTKDENGVFQGKYIEMYKTGEVFFICNMVDGKMHGEYRDYRDNGQLWEIRNYRYGNRHGENYLYRRDGSVGATMYYNGEDLGIDPRGMSDMDKLYVMMSGRRPVNE